MSVAASARNKAQEVYTIAGGGGVMFITVKSL